MFEMKSACKPGLTLTFVAVVLAGVALAAQATPPIKDVRKQVALTTDVKVGAVTLPSGQYQVSSKNEELTFRRLLPDPAYGGQWIVDSRQKPIAVKCTVSVLDARSDGTRLEIAAGDGGVAQLRSLTFEGTNIKFTIAQ